MAKIVIDGKTYEVDPANNLLQECLSQGLDLPYFCWHPCMGSVGACRQCAVKQYRDESDEKGTLVMACMTPATDGAIISVNDPQARQFRARVIESLMISHPHDCPVCEEGGECHLQDMTLMSGHNYRRYDKKKVTHNNQYLGPFINHEMNRCITCYRCVRFYDDYAGGTDLAAQASHHHVYFGRHEEGVLESEFSGNLVEVCPTGVFTDKVFSEHYSRKWDLQTAPSVCVGCAVGCNTAPGERYGSLRRIVNRYNSDVNGYFLCDRGRFGFDYVNSAERLRQANQIVAGVSTPISPAEVRDVVADFKQAQAIGIGSPRASNESNYALRCLVGEENFYAGMSDADFATVQLHIELARDPAFHVPGVREIEQADAIVILGEDVTNIAPRIALALRQAVRNKARELADACNIPQWQDAAVRELAQRELSPLCVLSTYATRLDDIASDSHVDSLAAIKDIAYALASALDGKAPTAKVSGIQADLVDRVAAQLQTAKRPLIIAGSSGGADMLKAGANIARALHHRRGQVIDLCVLAPEVNTVGLGLLTNSSNALSAALTRMAQGQATHAIVLENDLFRRAAHSEVSAALSKLEALMVIDQLPTATTALANYIVPATTFSEHEATYINYEGRAQLSYQVHRCHSDAQPAWRWLSEQPDTHVENFVNRCANEVANFAGLEAVLPDVSAFVAGMKIPRQLHRYSGRTAMKANVNVHEPKQATDTESPMSFSMEGIPSQKNASILASSWAPQWNSNQSISKFQAEINGELKQGSTGTILLGKQGESGNYYAPSAIARPASNDGLQLALASQIFGSDELSARSSAIQERMTAPYISISPQDAQARGLQQGDAVTVTGSDAPVLVCIRRKMKAGTAALYCGDNEIDAFSLPTQVELNKTDSQPARSVAGLIVSDLYEEGY